MQKRSLIHILVISTLLLAGTPAFSDSLAPFTGEAGSLKISGGTAHIPVMKQAAQQIMMANPKIRISIAGGGSGVGIKQAGEGLVDIGNSGRKATEAEIDRYQLVVHRWAIDGIAPVVNPQNTVKELSKTQLMAIFAGQIANWKDLGGDDRKINLYTRDEASGTREVFWDLALDKGAVNPGAHVVVSNGAMKSAIAQDPYGIGYVSVGHIDETVDAVTLDGITPNHETVEDGSYPVSRGLFSNTRGEPAGLTRKFLDYLYSPAGKQIVAEHGFIPAR